MLMTWLPEQIECSISMFADNTKIYTAVKDTASSRTFQVDLNLLVANDWLLRFNINKYKCMSVGPVDY